MLRQGIRVLRADCLLRVMMRFPRALAGHEVSLPSRSTATPFS